MQAYSAHRITQPRFEKARSMRNALDRARLRRATRLFEAAPVGATTDAEALKTMSAADITASQVFAQGTATEDR